MASACLEGGVILTRYLFSDVGSLAAADVKVPMAAAIWLQKNQQQKNNKKTTCVQLIN